MHHESNKSAAAFIYKVTVRPAQCRQAILELASSMINNSFVLRIFFLSAVLLITLCFGLHPKDFGNEHIPSMSQNGDLSFTKYSIATIDTNVVNAPEFDAEQGELRLGVKLEIPELPIHRGRFSVIFSINDIHGNSQMLVGQWKHSLVLMSGNDYSNQNNHPRITIPLDTVPGYAYPQKIRAEIITTAANTSVVINGHLMARSNQYIVPLRKGRFTVSLGNTLNRKHGWPGTISTFTMDYKICSTGDSSKNKSNCSQSLTVGLQKKAQNESKLSKHTSPQSSNLILHSPYTVLSTEWLSQGSRLHRIFPAHSKDVLINLLGFMPVALGLFIICAVKYSPIFSVITTILATVFLSLFIETVQVFLPSRTSSIIDLTTNSLAGVFIALLCYALLRGSMTPTKPRQ